MIHDKIETTGKYKALSEGFARAFELLQQGDIASKEDGRYEVDGDKLFYMVQNYVSQPVGECRFESHRRYADIQAVFAGREAMGYTQPGGLEVQTPYDEAKDIMFFATPADYTMLKLAAGEFVVLFPGEGHMPKCQSGGPMKIRKIVFKVLIED